MESFFNRLDLKEREYLVDHICFPCKLPQRGEKERRKNEGFYMHDHEPKFLSLITRVLHYFPQSPSYYSPLFPTLLRTFEEWKTLQNSPALNKQKVRESLNSLNPNDCFVAYLRQQNACILLTILPTSCKDMQ